jgi:hypothetical protein
MSILLPVNLHRRFYPRAVYARLFGICPKGLPTEAIYVGIGVRLLTGGVQKFGPRALDFDVEAMESDLII